MMMGRHLHCQALSLVRSFCLSRMRGVCFTHEANLLILMHSQMMHNMFQLALEAHSAFAAL